MSSFNRRDIVKTGAIVGTALALPSIFNSSSLSAEDRSPRRGRARIKAHTGDFDETILKYLVHGSAGDGGFRAIPANHHSAPDKWGSKLGFYLNDDSACDGATVDIVGLSEFSPERVIRLRPARPLVTALELYAPETHSGSEVIWERNEEFTFHVAPSVPKNPDFLELAPRIPDWGIPLGFRINNLLRDGAGLESMTRQGIATAADVDLITGGPSFSHSPIDDYAWLRALIYPEVGNADITAVWPEQLTGREPVFTRSHLIRVYTAGSGPYEVSPGVRDYEVGGAGRAEFALEARLTLFDPPKGLGEPGTATLELLSVDPDHNWAMLSLAARDRRNGAVVRYGSVGGFSPAPSVLPLNNPLDVARKDDDGNDVPYTVLTGLRGAARGFDRKLVPLVVGPEYK